ncbi:MAG: hypothetical protein K9G71_19750 [Rhodobacteraceae bacterium]|jgi:hypothetical protein|nr:hypothetical protein [Paracoccaceae bacterium]MCF8516586.1 hypothetical protein [Paracoccaceae bacterium]MCF8520939.1 hypothetical protein [Paracoccaceae bacterium]
MSVIVTMSLAFIASIFYVGAALFLKQWSSFPPVLAVLGITVCLALACVAEILVLQRARFAEVVILIITLEVGVAVVLSHFAFGEAYSLRDLTGIALLAIGAGVLLWQPTKEASLLPVNTAVASSDLTEII